MATETLTPEIIVAVFRHKDERIAGIEAAMQKVRPKCSASVGCYFSGAELRLYADFDTSYKPDGRPEWGTSSRGDDFDALCDQVLADITAYQADMFGTEVERMALAIIQIKHRDGTVTDRALRMADFTQEAIEQIHERAATLANEMSDGKPFEVEFVGESNHVAA